MRGRENNWEEREAGEIPLSRQNNRGRSHPSRGSRFDRGGGRGFRGGGRDGRGRGGHDISPRGYGARGRRAAAPPFRGGGRAGERPPTFRGGRTEDGRGHQHAGRGRDGRGRVDARGGRNIRYDEFPRSRAPEGHRASIGSDDPSLDSRFHRNHRDNCPSSRDHESVERPAPLQVFPQRPRAPSNGSEGEILSESELTPPPGGDSHNYSVGPPPNSIRIDQRPPPNDLDQRWHSSRDRPDSQPGSGLSMNGEFTNDRRPNFQADRRPSAEDQLRREKEFDGINHRPPGNYRNLRDGGREDQGPSRIPLEQSITSRDRPVNHHQRPSIPQHEPGQIVDLPDPQPTVPSPFGMHNLPSPRHMDQRDSFPRGGRGMRMHGSRGRGRECRELELSREQHSHGRTFESRGEDHHRFPGRSFEGRGDSRGGHRAPGPERSFEGRGREHSRTDPVGRGFEGRGGGLGFDGRGRGFEGRGREYSRIDSGRSLGGRGHEQHRIQGMGRGFEGRGRFDSGGSLAGRARENEHGSHRSFEGRGLRGSDGRGRGPIGGGRGWLEQDPEGIRSGRGNDRPWNREDRFRSISPRSSSHGPQPTYSYQEPRQDEERRGEYHSAPTAQPTITRSFASFAVENELIQAKAVSSMLGEGPIAPTSISSIPVSSSSYIMDAKGLAGEKIVEALALKPKDPPKPKTPPPTPPPEPSAPSAYVTSLTRLAEVEAQMEFEFAKLTRLCMKRQMVQAERDTLSNLPAGRDAFQEDLNKYLSEHGVDDAKKGTNNEALDGVCS